MFTSPSSLLASLLPWRYVNTGQASELKGFEKGGILKGVSTNADCSGCMSSHLHQIHAYKIDAEKQARS